MKKIITAAVIIIMTICFTSCSEPEDTPTVETASATTTKEAKEKPVPAVEVTTPTITAVTAEPATSSKNDKHDEEYYFCPECGQEVSEPDTLYDVCGEPYYRLYGYGWVRCHVYSPGEVDWYMDKTLPCTYLPNEVCDHCRDKLNHGWKTSGEKKYYEYSDFLKEKGLTLVEASHPEQEQTTLTEPGTIEEPEPVEDIPKETKEEEPPCEENTTTSNSIM